MTSAAPSARADEDFRLSITIALRDQLAAHLSRLTPRRLTPEALAGLRNEPGIYVLWQGRQRVYVGKAQTSLPARLGQHHRKIAGREGLGQHKVQFCCLYVAEDLQAVAPEKSLISLYRSKGGVPWNSNGFGNKDPGKNRDKTVVPENHFDARYKADLSWAIELPQARAATRQRPATNPTIREVLLATKKQLPYLLRYQRGAATTEPYARRINVPPGPTPFTDVMSLVIAGLGSGWQATALPGYVILYKTSETFPSARGYWRPRGVSALFRAQQPGTGPREDIAEDDPIDDQPGDSD